MSNRRLLACTCGRTVPVEPRQAGGETTCACGAKLLIPPLRQLRDLPEETTAASQSRTTWGVAHGITSLLVVVALLLSTVAGYFRVTEPPKPLPFDFSNWQTQSKEGIAKLTPDQLWQRWIDVYAPQTGSDFHIYKSVEDQIATETIARHRKLEGYLGIGAAIFAAMAGLLFAMFKARGRGEQSSLGPPTRAKITFARVEDPSYKRRSRPDSWQTLAAVTIATSGGRYLLAGRVRASRCSR